MTNRILRVSVRWPEGGPLLAAGQRWHVEWVAADGRAVATAAVVISEPQRGEAILQLPPSVEGQGSARMRVIDDQTSLTIAHAPDVAYDLL